LDIFYYFMGSLGVLGYATSSLAQPDGVRVKMVLGDDSKRYATWRVNPNKLTDAEIQWLTEQDDLKKPPSKCKPVSWSALTKRMAQEAHERGQADFRPLHQDTIGLAWDRKLWRFEGQMEEFPVFDETLKWGGWIKSNAGLRWIGTK
jgi:hypothetical protein